MYGQRGQKKWRLCRRVVNQTIILIFRSFAHFSSLTGLESVASSCTKTLELRFLKIAPTFKVQDFLQVSPVPPPVPYPTPFINVLMVSRSGRPSIVGSARNLEARLSQPHGPRNVCAVQQLMALSSWYRGPIQYLDDSAISCWTAQTFRGP